MNVDYCTPMAPLVWQYENHAQEEEAEEISRGRNREGDGAGANWNTEGVEDRGRSEEERRKTQAYTG
ncbi:MAG: hypothetical protein WAN70_01865 [Terriglobales bacterium]|jgi:hypothetical protein